nr:EOG090X0AVR [Lepidurus arcticus]
MEQVRPTEMDQELAKLLFEEGATLVLQDVPVGTEFGIDLASWNTGEKFRGVKMIPPGLHFIYFSAVGKEGQAAPRTGFFKFFEKKELYARKWDLALENFVDTSMLNTKLYQKRMKDNLKELDQFLGAYPYDKWKKWVSLTNKISTEVLSVLEPVNQVISSVPQLESQTFRSQRNKAEATERDTCAPTQEEIPVKRRCIQTTEEWEESLLPVMKHKEGTELRFTQIPHTFPEGAQGADVTKYSLDSTFALEQLLSRYKREEDLLGELQFAFSCFLVGQVYDAFEQWKKLVRVICTSDAALTSKPQLFIDFVNDLYFQMQEVPADFFVDIVSRDNFLTQTLRTLFTNIEGNAQVERRLKSRAQRLQETLSARFGWDFMEEPEDEAPVIVELDA